jgi:hypothetical protein
MPPVNGLGHVSVNTKIICKLTLLSGVSIKYENFIKSGNEMLEITLLK